MNKGYDWCEKHSCRMTGFSSLYCVHCVKEEEAVKATKTGEFPAITGFEDEGFFVAFQTPQKITTGLPTPQGLSPGQVVYATVKKVLEDCMMSRAHHLAPHPPQWHIYRLKLKALSANFCETKNIFGLKQATKLLPFTPGTFELIKVV